MKGMVRCPCWKSHGAKHSVICMNNVYCFFRGICLTKNPNQSYISLVKKDASYLRYFITITLLLQKVESYSNERACTCWDSERSLTNGFIDIVSNEICVKNKRTHNWKLND